MEAGPRLSPTSLVGRVVDSRYELLDYIASGTVTHVFRSWDGRLQRMVVVKILRESLSDGAGVADAFVDAARRAATLPRHPHTVQVYEAGRDAELTYMVTAFVSGTTVRELIASQAPLPVDRAFRICRQTAQALAFVHEHGIIHDGVEPSNLLLTPADEVRLTDIGIGRAIEMADLGRTRPLARAHPYLSPTQTGTEADVYALGVVLYEMLVSIPPFSEDDPVGLARRQMSADPPDPRLANPDIPATAAVVVWRALSLNQGYGTAGAFAAALQGFLLHKRSHPSLAVPSIGASQEESTVPLAPSVPAVKHVAPSMDESRRRRTRTSWRPWATLAFLLTIGIAVAGGYVVYRPLRDLLNGSSGGSTPTPIHHRLRPAAAHPRAKHGSRVAGAGVSSGGSAACTSGGPGVRLADMYAEEIRPAPGQPDVFDYTISNAASRCQNVKLLLTAFSGAQPTVAITNSTQDKIVLAAPGTHVYKRQFTFPSSSAGQVLTVRLTVTDPSGRITYGENTQPNLITVAAH
ncbi:MAG: serine/threonine-protein kinase [Chloroflexota bacterium]